LQKAEEILSNIIRYFGMISTGFLLIMMMLTVCDVILRFFFGRPISGSYELTGLLMVFVAFLGLAWCALQEGHIMVEFLAEKLPKKVQMFLEYVNYTLLLTVCGLLGWQSFAAAMVYRELGTRYNVTGLLRYPFVLVVTLGYVLIFVAGVILLKNYHKKVKQ
jgi:TRAP-type C4-dicarboxylate transport system permease small subunit